MALLKPFETALKEYCIQNSLSYDKVISFPRCGNDKVLFIQYVDKTNVYNKTANNIPAEILITATIEEDGKIQFSKGENADKYLHI